MLREYKIQVPSKPPKNVIEDINGRLWAPSIPTNDKEIFLQWDTEDTWYVWFQGDPPDIDEEVTLNGKTRMIHSVLRVYRLHRAVVTFS